MTAKAVEVSTKSVPMYGRAFLCLVFLLLLYVPRSNAAPAIEELAPLDFGTVAVPDNSLVSSLSLSRSERIQIEGAFILISSGTAGRLRLTGFPANVGVEIDADLAELDIEGATISERLSVTAYDFGDIRTDSNGSVDIFFGGTIETSGNGQAYEDGPYDGTAQFRFTYWNPDINDYSVVSDQFSFAATLSTGLNIESVQSLNFGTIFARTTNADQASIILSPGGGLGIDNPGDSRIVSLSDPEPGLISIVGAAPNRELSVVPDATDVLLVNGAEPSAPHFVLSDITTLLSNEGRTDSDGYMEIRVGGTLTTEQTDTTIVYPDGTYEGTYIIEISY
ncbi:DUF4402 domain-containing protein [Marinobacter sp. CHS3-4]|uniref:DUF4402 domain-containing protein n=1 Tax=Marinobacter sp. CHS3-4 TaxID=3045174 RepID=UPI0024B60CEE|nr:DUF4402 domain-containing protein [Marinobacter sp. CHS3-4]MDI9244470.1 DUF4402 domain-containing protein [Marinobacter sp. CHS3-4]